jgi:hypothetical protein
VGGSATGVLLCGMGADGAGDGCSGAAGGFVGGMAAGGGCNGGAAGVGAGCFGCEGINDSTLLVVLELRVTADGKAAVPAVMIEEALVYIRKKYILI